MRTASGIWEHRCIRLATSALFWRFSGRTVRFLRWCVAVEPLSSVIAFRFRDEVLPYYGGGFEEARRCAANDFMYWELMRRACDKGARVFDFGRSKVGTGAFAYKGIWGFEPQPLHYEYFLLRAVRDAQRKSAQPEVRFWGRALAAPAAVRRQRTRPAYRSRPRVRRLAEILFLAHRIPAPPTKGDKIRAYHFLSHLARAHVVHLGCFIDDPGDWRHADDLRGWCHECQFVALPPARFRRRAVSALARGEAVSVAALRDPALADWIGGLLRRRAIDSVFAYSSAMAQYLEGVPEGVRRVVDFVDLDSEKWRQLAARRHWPWSWLYRRESERLRAFDRDAADRSDRCLFVSPAEAQSFLDLIPGAAPKTLVIPNGVDGGYFSPGGRPPARSARAAPCSPSPAT